MPGAFGSRDSVALVCYITASSLAKGPVLWMSAMLTKPYLGQLCLLAFGHSADWFIKDTSCIASQI